MKIVSVIMAAALAVLLNAADASAQQKKKKADPFCGPNGMEVCIKACTNRGGQARHCPQYCNQQRVQRCS
jgi:hypothetical protein